MTQPWTPDGWRPGRHDAEPLTGAELTAMAVLAALVFGGLGGAIWVWLA